MLLLKSSNHAGKSGIHFHREDGSLYEINSTMEPLKTGWFLLENGNFQFYW